MNTLRPLVENVRALLLNDIIQQLTTHDEMRFVPGKKLTTAREIIAGIVQQDSEVIVITTDQTTGEGLYHDLDDDRFVLVEDLVWIHEQVARVA